MFFVTVFAYLRHYLFGFGTKGRTYEGVDVVIDGRSFDRCVFRDCRLVFLGTGLETRLTSSSITDCTLFFAGAAGQTLNLLATLHQTGFHEAVEQTLTKILEQKHEQTH